jgi:Flp pilus assembly protein TadB
MSNSEVSTDRVYTQEEIQNILNLAIADHAYQGEFSRSQLFEIASELGISNAVLQKAEQTWMRSKDDLAKREEFNQHRRTELKQKLVRFGIVNVGVLALNTLVGLGFLWPLYVLVLVGWSVLLGLKAWNVFYLDGEAYEQAFQRWYRKNQVRKVVSHWLGRWLSV